MTKLVIGTSFVIVNAFKALGINSRVCAGHASFFYQVFVVTELKSLYTHSKRLKFWPVTQVCVCVCVITCSVSMETTLGAVQTSNKLNSVTFDRPSEETEMFVPAVFEITEMFQTSNIQAALV